MFNYITSSNLFNYYYNLKYLENKEVSDNEIFNIFNSLCNKEKEALFFYLIMLYDNNSILYKSDYFTDNKVEEIYINYK